MMKKSCLTQLFAVAAVFALAAQAAEVKVISTVAARAALEELKPMFERATPHTLTIVYGTAVLMKRKGMEAP